MASSSSLVRAGGSQADPFLYLFAIILPPLAVALRQGSTSAEISTNVLLTLLGWIPGVLNAWYLIARPPAVSSPQHNKNPPATWPSKDRGHRRSGSGSVHKAVYIDSGRGSGGGSSRRHQHHQPDMEYVPVPVRTRSRSRNRNQASRDYGVGQPQIVLKRAH